MRQSKRIACLLLISVYWGGGWAPRGVATHPPPQSSTHRQPLLSCLLNPYLHTYVHTWSFDPRTKPTNCPPTYPATHPPKFTCRAHLEPTVPPTPNPPPTDRDPPPTSPKHTPNFFTPSLHQPTFAPLPFLFFPIFANHNTPYPGGKLRQRLTTNGEPVNGSPPSFFCIFLTNPAI